MGGIAPPSVISRSGIAERALELQRCAAASLNPASALSRDAPPYPHNTTRCLETLRPLLIALSRCSNTTLASLYRFARLFPDEIALHEPRC